MKVTQSCTGPSLCNAAAIYQGLAHLHWERSDRCTLDIYGGGGADERPEEVNAGLILGLLRIF